ncbi:CubicO group peptidase (beta-lactamase class C family) [Pedobacter cryoconitis]|uniref:serine hydrolase domain-containing protein n=1 Tax=Pedobacter cryoconitis TaxID=188932 RepID=UPI0016209469|nr:serine hydrolase [Pedobacter cryoconitis]MBB6274671.1 CubicO group peptidase (beta-lactamase class C family) [Pedobacter cryoconitis]
MKRILCWLAAVILLIVLLFAVLFTWRPELVRVLRYQSPDANTYKIFPQAIIQPSDSAFHFVKAAVNRDDLDTVKVLNWKNESVPFTTFLKDGQANLFMVIRNDTIIYQKFAPGYSDTTLTTLFSVAKTMVSIMVGEAIKEGKIKSLDDQLISYVPELKVNPAFDQITLRNLLDMKSGLEFKDVYGGIIAAFLSDEAKYYYTEDIKKELIKVKAVNPPGAVWKYKSIDAFLLTWALENATGKKAATYFQDKIWKKIGTAYPASFGLDHVNGLANTASRFQSTAIDLAKLGRLYLNKGQYDGDQVISQDWVTRSVNMGKDTPANSKGWQQSAQHYLWWVPQQGINGDYAAEGMRGQRLYIDPLTHTIIVQFSGKGAGGYPFRKISRYLSGLPFTYPKNPPLEPAISQ